LAVVAIVGYVLLTWIIVAPIRRMAVATQRVAAGDFASRVELASHNEIGELAGHFNRMLQRIDESRRALESQLHALAAAKRELEEAQAAIVRSEKLASVGRLAAGVAHEVGNPLAAILGLIELLRDDPDVPASERQDMLGRMERELSRISDTIRGLLDYSRRGDDRLADVHLEDVITHARKLVEAQPRAREIHFTVTLPQDLPDVRAHADRLIQVLVNLFLNAVDAIGTKGEIRCTASRRDGGVELAVPTRGQAFPQRLSPTFSSPSTPPSRLVGGPGWDWPSVSASSRIWAAISTSTPAVVGGAPLSACGFRTRRKGLESIGENGDLEVAWFGCATPLLEAHHPMNFAPTFNQALLGLIICEGVASARATKQPFGPAKLHLLSYLLHRLGTPLAYLFDLHYYGPHSAQLAADIKILVNHKVITHGPPPPGTFSEFVIVDLTPLDRTHGRRLQSERERIVSNVGGLLPLSLEEIELLATVDAVYRSLRRAVPSDDVEKAVVDSIVMLKRSKFTPTQISDTYHRLANSVLFSA
jgi:HAMP domain-containing protein